MQETASNAGGSSSPASSLATVIVRSGSAPQTQPSNNSAPVVSGRTVVGQTLSASTGAWSATPPIAYSYQWMRCSSSSSAIPGATSSTVALVSADVGVKLAVAVTASNSAGTSTAYSQQVGPVTSPGPTAGQINATLAQASAVSGKAATIIQLLKHGGYTASVAGRLVIAWDPALNGARLGSAKKPVLVATATVVFHQAGNAKVKVTLTAEGRRLLKGAESIKLTDKVAFTPPAAFPLPPRGRFGSSDSGTPIARGGEPRETVPLHAVTRGLYERPACVSRNRTDEDPAWTGPVQTPTRPRPAAPGGMRTWELVSVG